MCNLSVVAVAVVYEGCWSSLELLRIYQRHMPIDAFLSAMKVDISTLNVIPIEVKSQL